MDRDEILESVARTLFVTAFADACTDEEAHPDFDAGDQAAGAGENWFDTVTDPTPEAATVKAAEIAADFEARNGRTVEDAAAEWAGYPGHVREPNEDRFGYFLAMQSLGAGVGLWDDAVAPREARFATGYFWFDACDWL